MLKIDLILQVILICFVQNPTSESDSECFYRVFIHKEIAQKITRLPHVMLQNSFRDVHFIDVNVVLEFK